MWEGVKEGNRRSLLYVLVLVSSQLARYSTLNDQHPFAERRGAKAQLPMIDDCSKR